MASSLFFAPVSSLSPSSKAGLFIGNSVPGKVLRANEVLQHSTASKFQSLEVKIALPVLSDCGLESKVSGWFGTIGKIDSQIGFLYQATGDNQSIKPRSLVCSNCDGNGAVACSQCKGSGVNSVDHFNGQFKAGGLCWLCRGKREMLCGDCNGAGFLGGFMSTCDE